MYFTNSLSHADAGRRAIDVSRRRGHGYQLQQQSLLWVPWCMQLQCGTPCWRVYGGRVIKHHGDRSSSYWLLVVTPKSQDVSRWFITQQDELWPILMVNGLHEANRGSDQCLCCRDGPPGIPKLFDKSNPVDLHVHIPLSYLVSEESETLWWVCLFVGLSARTKTKTTRGRTSPNVCAFACGHDSVLLWRLCDMLHPLGSVARHVCS